MSHWRGKPSARGRRRSTGHGRPPFRSRSRRGRALQGGKEGSLGRRWELQHPGSPGGGPFQELVCVQVQASRTGLAHGVSSQEAAQGVLHDCMAPGRSPAREADVATDLGLQQGRVENVLLEGRTAPTQAQHDLLTFPGPPHRHRTVTHATEIARMGCLGHLGLLSSLRGPRTAPSARPGHLRERAPVTVEPPAVPASTAVEGRPSAPTPRTPPGQKFRACGRPDPWGTSNATAPSP